MYFLLSSKCTPAPLINGRKNIVNSFNMNDITDIQCSLLYRLTGDILRLCKGNELHANPPSSLHTCLVQEGECDPKLDLTGLIAAGVLLYRAHVYTE